VKKLVLAWLEKGQTELVVVHSENLASSEATMAWALFKKGRYVDGPIPIVFLDSSLDTPELRWFINKKSFVKVYKVAEQASLPVALLEGALPHTSLARVQNFP